MHTPGPWAAGRSIPEDGAVSRIVRAGDDHIAVVMHLEDAAQEAADNARLIAAAPELLAALNALLNLSVKGHALADRLQFSDSGRAILNQARAAIARATGSQ